MKICILIDRIPPEGKGGAERVAVETARALTARGHSVTLITATAQDIPGGLREENVDGVRIISIYSRYPERWRAWRSLYNPGPVKIIRRLFAEIQPDIVHVHNVHYDLSYHVLKLAKEAGSRVFITAHDVMLFHYAKLVEFIDPANPVCKKEWDYHVKVTDQIRRYRWRYNPLRNLVIRYYVRRYTDKRFAVSKALQRAYAQNGLPGFEVLYTGINADEWEIKPDSIRTFKEKFNLQGRKVILFGGRITRLKGGDVLLEALKKIVQEVPTALVLIAGMADHYVEELQDRTRAAGLSEHVRVTGWLEGDELRAAYHASDVITVPSVCFDSFPVTNLEAMACSKPVVATCFGGSSESIEDEVTGYIVNPYNIDDLATKIIDLLMNDTKRTIFGEAAHDRVIREFSLQQHFTALEKAYLDK